MRIAIIGSTGLLGSNLVKLYKTMKIDVQGFSRSTSNNIDSLHNHIIDFNQLEKKLNLHFKIWQPDIIINAVALVNLKEYEKQKKYCYKINVNIAEKLAFLAKRYCSYYIHISTYHYYNDMNKKHSEIDPITVLNYYAETKRKAETKVLHAYSNSLVVRTNIIGFRNTESLSFFEWLLKALKEKIPIELYTDYYTSPIDVRELRKLLLDCNNNKLVGLYNIASSQIISKYNFGILVAKKFGLTDYLISKSTINSINKNDEPKNSIIGSML